MRLTHTNKQLEGDSTAQKMNFSIKDFCSKCDQIRRKLQIWSHLWKKSLIKNLTFLCSVCICRHLLKSMNPRTFSLSVLISNTARMKKLFSYQETFNCKLETSTLYVTLCQHKRISCYININNRKYCARQDPCSIIVSFIYFDTREWTNG